jgi:aminoglycoside 3-N-acetyltransferase
MPPPFRSGLKRLAQKILGQDDVRGYVRKQKLRLTKQIYRRPIAVAELRQLLIDLGVTRGRTVWVHSSWNEFYNVPLKPTEMIALLRDLIGPEGTLAMPAFPLDQNPDKVFLVDRAPTYTGMLCEIFRRNPEAKRSIHLGSSVCALGPNADYLLRDHHHTEFPWGDNTPFARLLEADARVLGLGAGFEYMTLLHMVECLLYEEIPYFRQVFDGTIKYRWARANGETGEHEFRRRVGAIKPLRLRRHFGPDILTDTKISNLKILAIDARPLVARGIELGRRGIVGYSDPAPRPELFLPDRAG